MKVEYYPGVQRYLSSGTSSGRSSTYAVVGLGYVGLPTALELRATGSAVIGIDVDVDRLTAIREGNFDRSSIDPAVEAIVDEKFTLTTDASAIRGVDGVIIAVPTPTDHERRPDASALERACASVVENARTGQTIVLVSTSAIGSTRRLLVEPIERRGLVVGEDVFIAFSPERLNPGSTTGTQRRIPRVVGGVTPACTRAAARIIGQLSSGIHRVGSPEAAEMAKLVENTFRAVNIALANEFADVAHAHGISIREVIDAASSKPYGFMAFEPGPGVGGHCIPCDPHYLLESVRGARMYAPVVEQAMLTIDARPAKVVDRAVEILSRDGVAVDGARVALVGLAYKAGVADLRESPSTRIATLLRSRGMTVVAHDPHVDGDGVDHEGIAIPNEKLAAIGAVDLAIVLTSPSVAARSWIERVGRVLDATYSIGDGTGVETL